MCTLHAGGKFDSKVYETSGGLHGVGVSVANALSERMEVEVARGQKLYRMAFERGKPKGKLQDAGKAPNRRGTKVRFRPDPEIFGAKRAFQARARFQDDALEGVSVRRRRNSLVVRQGAAARRGRRAGSGDVPFRRRPERLSLGNTRGRDSRPSRHFHRHGRKDRRARRGAMGRGLDRRRRRLPQFVLQHHPDARRRHPRIRAARGAQPRPEGPRRTDRPGQARSRHHQRRRDDRRRRHAVGVHPRARIPGPDQGPPRHGRSAADRRAGDQRPVRSLARRQPGAGQQALRLRGRARRGTHPPPPGKRHRAQDRRAQASAARETRRLHQQRGRRLGAFHRRGRFRRRLGQAGARPRGAGDPAVARKNPQRRLRRQGQARAEPADRRSGRRRSAAAPARIIATRICATDASSS